MKNVEQFRTHFLMDEEISTHTHVQNTKKKNDTRNCTKKDISAHILYFYHISSQSLFGIRSPPDYFDRNGQNEALTKHAQKYSKLTCLIADPTEGIIHKNYDRDCI